MIFLEVDPNVVKPGWTPLIITILLAAAIALLMISMRRQMRKVRVPHRGDLNGTETAEPTPASAPSPQDDPAEPDPKSAEQRAGGDATRPGS